MSHIFISYSRKDIDFAAKIVHALSEGDPENKLDTWIDWKSIPKGEDWEQEIYRGIEEADAFLFLISPDSVTSEMCNKEIAHAVKNGKRILPIFIADVDDRGIYDVTEKFLHKDPKEEISRRNFIKCRVRRDSFEKVIEEIQTTIHTDYEWLKFHTELQVKALKWEQKKDNSRLLRGKELREAEQQFFEVSSQEDPQPTKLQREYILASQRNEVHARRQITVGLGFGLAIMIALSIFAWAQRDNAISESNAKATALVNEESARATALAEKDRAELQAKISLSRQLATQAKSVFSQNPLLSMLLSVEAEQTNQTLEAKSALLESLTGTNPLKAYLLDQTAINALTISPDSSIFTSAGDDGTIVVWGMSDDRRSYKIYSSLNIDDGPVFDVAFGDGNILVASNNDQSIFWDLSNPYNPVEIGEVQIGGAISLVNIDHHKILVEDDFGFYYFWDVTDLQSPVQVGQSLLDHSDIAHGAVFVKDNIALLGSYGLDGKIYLVDFSDPSRPFQVAGPLFPDGLVTSLTFTQDGKYLISGSVHNTGDITIWDISDPLQPLKLSHFPAHDAGVSALLFLPSDNILVSGGLDNVLKLWDLSNPDDPQEIGKSLVGHSKAIESIVFNGRYLFSGGGDGIIMWNISDSAEPDRLGQSIEIGDAVKLLKISSDEKSMAVVSISCVGCEVENRVYLWDLQMNLQVFRYEPRNWSVSDIEFLPTKNQLILSGCTKSDGFLGCNQGVIAYWDVTNPAKPLGIQDPVYLDTPNIRSISINETGNILSVTTYNPDATVFLDITKLSTPQKLMDENLQVIGDQIFSLPYWNSQSEQFKNDSLYVLNPNKNIVLVVKNEGRGSQTIQVLDMSTPQPILLGETPPFSDHVYTVAYNSDEGLLASGNGSGEITLWNISATFGFTKIGVLSTGKEGLISNLVYLENGKKLISANSGGIVYWNLDETSWINDVCEIVNRNLTHAEWNQYIGEYIPYHATCPNLPTPTK